MSSKSSHANLPPNRMAQTESVQTINTERDEESSHKKLVGSFAEKHKMLATMDSRALSKGNYLSL